MQFEILQKKSVIHQMIGCPLVLKAYELSIDTASNKCLLQLQLCNNGIKSIRTVSVKIKCFDADDMEFQMLEDFSYQDLIAPIGTLFGDKIYLELPDERTRKAAIQIKKIAFVDGSLWENSTNEFLKPKEIQENNNTGYQNQNADIFTEKIEIEEEEEQNNDNISNASGRKRSKILFGSLILGLGLALAFLIYRLAGQEEPDNRTAGIIENFDHIQHLLSLDEFIYFYNEIHISIDDLSPQENEELYTYIADISKDMIDEQGGIKLDDNTTLELNPNSDLEHKITEVTYVQERFNGNGHKYSLDITIVHLVKILRGLNINLDKDELYPIFQKITQGEDFTHNNIEYRQIKTDFNKLQLNMKYIGDESDLIK